MSATTSPVPESAVPPAASEGQDQPLADGTYAPDIAEEKAIEEPVTGSQADQIGVENNSEGIVPEGQQQPAAQEEEPVAVEESAAGSLIGIPESNPETSLWALFDQQTVDEVDADCQKATEQLGGRASTTSQETAKNLIREYKSYSGRLNTQEESLNTQIDSIIQEQDDEEAQLAARLEEEVRMFEESLQQQYGKTAPVTIDKVKRLKIAKSQQQLDREKRVAAAAAASQAASGRSTQFPRKSPSPTKGDADEETDCKKVIDFWKTKHADLQAHFESQAEELEDMSSKLNDLRYLQNSTDQDLFKTHRLIGLLREREATERLKADAYHQMLQDLIVPPKLSSAVNSPRSGASANPSFAGRNSTGPGNSGSATTAPGATSNSTGGFSAIEESLLKSEMEGIQRVAKEVELRRQLLIQAQEKRTIHLDDLHDKLETTVGKLGIRQTAQGGVNLEETLAEVMEMRDESDRAQEQAKKASLKDSGLVGDDVETVPGAPSAKQQAAWDDEIERLQRELAEVKDSTHNAGKRLMEQLRECKVESIRTLYRSCGDVDSTFQRLKMEQQINVLTDSLTKATEVKARMSHAVHETEDNVKMQAGFLDKMKKTPAASNGSPNY